MQATIEPTQSRRRSLRRAVQLEAEVASTLWEGTVPFLATNVSAHGLWLETDLPFDIGERLHVSLTPPRWASDRPLRATAEVARVGMFRRRSERSRPGMGLTFVGLDPADARKLQACLRGLPPPLPVKRSQARAATAPLHARAEAGPLRLAELELADGSRFVLRAEGAFLTAGRGPVLVPSRAARRPCVPVSCTMTAILRTRER